MGQFSLETSNVSGLYLCVNKYSVSRSFIWEISMNTIQQKHPITRRTFLKGSLAAITTALLGSEGYLTQGQIFKPNIVRAQSQALVLAIQEFAHDALKDVLQDFEEETGL